MAAENTARRSPGAQPGNTNALKHGFYSRSFRKQEMIDLEHSVSRSLGDEIAMLRVFIRRLFDLASEEAPDIELTTKVLGEVSRSSSRLSALYRQEDRMAESRDDTAAALSQALGEVLAELRA